MERQVVPERHAVNGSYWPDQRAESDTAAGIIRRPVRKIEDLARAVDVSHYLPRNRRDVCPDRPTRLARVAVVACAPQNPLYITRRVGVACTRAVYTLDRHELDDDEHSGQEKSSYLGVAFHELSNQLSRPIPPAVTVYLV